MNSKTLGREEEIWELRRSFIVKHIYFCNEIGKFQWKHKTDIKITSLSILSG